ncbi:MAG TPA: HPr family phosphocarrier protein [Ruminococcaceae bacterium]|jgi:phosphocarrier protein|nr:HPr family phosphocarrier protein [Oscillospiraceae bacterium]HBG56268.1 HPr family phosphocarrier protein [Oscillospiraceae bacterium]HBQ46294.1 HPr family phosphocarrier protein [Oscillospiraceae bacterium]HBT90253.1 HPr family phosphocarrier protein [Oscillospiraceae bacterium]HCB90419.1 HPr family phosphocarrier protein [Oscillospiraceae bacterium]
MVTQQVTITNPSGLHARPASQFCRFLRKFKSKVFLVTEAGKVDCASIINLLSMAIKQGTTVKLEVTGEDEEKALPEIAEFLQNLKE